MPVDNMSMKHGCRINNFCGAIILRIRVQLRKGMRVGGQAFSWTGRCCGHRVKKDMKKTGVRMRDCDNNNRIAGRYGRTRDVSGYKSTLMILTV